MKRIVLLIMAVIFVTILSSCTIHDVNSLKLVYDQETGICEVTNIGNEKMKNVNAYFEAYDQDMKKVILYKNLGDLNVNQAQTFYIYECLDDTENIKEMVLTDYTFSPDKTYVYIIFAIIALFVFANIFYLKFVKGGHLIC